MLEQECFLLDIKLAGQNAVHNNRMTQEEYDKIIETYQKIKDLEYYIQDCTEKVDLVNEAISLHMFKNPEREIEIQNAYQPRLKHLFTEIQQKVYTLIILKCFSIYLNIHVTL